MNDLHDAMTRLGEGMNGRPSNFLVYARAGDIHLVLQELWKLGYPRPWSQREGSQQAQIDNIVDQLISINCELNLLKTELRKTKP